MNFYFILNYLLLINVLHLINDTYINRFNRFKQMCRHKFHSIRQCTIGFKPLCSREHAHLLS